MTDAFASAPCRVVVCDDVADFRDLLIAMLERAEGICVVGEAGNGREAIALAATEQPDVVLLDVAMPVMDGIEALPHIRHAAPNSKVIVLTGFASGAVRDQALAAGAADYIEKGARPDNLVEAIRSACAG